MTLRSRRSAAPRIAKALVVGCFCLIGTVNIERGEVGARAAHAAGDAAKARELFRQGSVFFDSGQFGKAVEAWQHAYEEKQDPGLLYNIGQAYRLAGDPRRALFFYRSFLRKTPKSAREREDAEQKVETLQAQIAAEDQAKTQAKGQAPTGAPAATQAASTPPPSPPSAPAPPAPPAATPPAPPSNLLPTGAPEVPDPAPNDAGLQPERVTPPASHVGGDVRDELRGPTDPIDFGLAPGVTIWLAGPASGRRAAFAATAVLGYTLGADDHDARLRFRIGALFGYASLHEPNGSDTFLDVLIAPTLRIRAWDQRLFVSVDLGVGVMILAGLKPSSDFLAHNQAATAVGTQSILELRPGATVTYRLYPAVELFAGPALAWNPKKPHFHEPMLRLQLLGGVALRF